MTYDITGFAAQTTIGRASEGTWRALRLTRDGGQIVLPWYQSLVMESRVWGIHAGSVTTPIAGHAAIDADQPEAAAYIGTGIVLIPLSVRGAQETGATTLAQGGMMAAVSNISVGAGTSTAFTPFNLNLATARSATAAAAVAYTGNGTDPLTAGNFLELARVSSVIDADAATSGIIPPTLNWNCYDSIAPILYDGASFLFYAEAAANTVFATLTWAELDPTWVL